MEQKIKQLITDAWNRTTLGSCLKFTNKYGWLSENYLTNEQCSMLNTNPKFEIKKEDFCWYYRPIELSGLETNNGWFKVSDETFNELKKIYNDDTEFYYCVDGVYSDKTIILDVINEMLKLKNITHIRPKTNIKNPLY